MLEYNKYNDKIVTAGAKVVVKERGLDGREGIGFVKKVDDNGNAHVYLEDKNEVILMKMPTFTRVTGVWFYDYNDESDYSIIKMNPVRLKLLST